MKKISLWIVLCLFLSGCTIHQSDILETSIKKIASSEYSVEVSNYKKFYDYYVSPGLKVKDSSELSSLIQSEHNMIVLNINVSNIVNEIYYDKANVGLKGISSFDHVITHFEGELINSESEAYPYSMILYKIQNEYMIYLNSLYVDLYCILDQPSISKVASEMMIIAKSVIIDKQLVAKEYSNVNKIDYIKEQIKLFEVVVPENGRVEEIMLNGIIPEDNSGHVEDTTENVNEGESYD